MQHSISVKKKVNVIVKCPFSISGYDRNIQVRLSKNILGIIHVSDYICIEFGANP